MIEKFYPIPSTHHRSRLKLVNPLFIGDRHKIPVSLVIYQLQATQGGKDAAMNRIVLATGISLLAAATAIGTPEEIRAEDCLLDTNNDGNADSNVDGDLGADSAGTNDRLACGENANASDTASH